MILNNKDLPGFVHCRAAVTDTGLSAVHCPSLPIAEFAVKRVLAAALEAAIGRRRTSPVLLSMARGTKSTAVLGATVETEQNVSLEARRRILERSRSEDRLLDAPRTRYFHPEFPSRFYAPP